MNETKIAKIKEERKEDNNILKKYKADELLGKKYDRSLIFKKAWEMKKVTGLTFSECLSTAWRVAKAVKHNFFANTWRDQVVKEMIQELTGKNIYQVNLNAWEPVGKTSKPIKRVYISVNLAGKDTECGYLDAANGFEYHTDAKTKLDVSEVFNKLRFFVNIF